MKMYFLLKTLITHFRLRSDTVAMYRSKAVLPSLRNAYTKIPNRSYRSRLQVGFSLWQFRSFTSKPVSMLQLVLENDWSKQVPEGLRKPNTPLTHETAVYVLRKLAKHPEKAYSFLSWVLRESDLTPSSPLYSTMLRMILVQQRPMKRFWTTLNDMKQGGFCLDEETYKTIYTLLNRESYKDATALTRFYESLLEDNAMSVVADNVSASVSQKDWSCEVERELQGMKLPLSDNFVIMVLKGLKEHPLKAFSFLRWVGGGCCYKNSTVTHNAALRVLARPSSVAEFWSVVAEMKEAGHEVDFDTYVKASRQFQMSRMMIEAVKLYEFMTDGPFKPSVEDCTLLLRSLSAGPSPDLDLAYRVARKYESTGKPLSKAVYDGIYRYLTSVARFDEAEEVTMGMRDAGCKPDSVTYSQLVFGLCKAKRLEEARGVVLDQMEADGCLPDVKTWTVLIQGHFENSEVDKAFACFANMVEKGIGVDSGLLDVVVGMFLSQNRVEEACEFLKAKVENGNVKAWRSTYKGVIDKLHEIKKGEEALDLVRMMKKQNCTAYAKESFDGKDAKMQKSLLVRSSSKYYHPSFIDVMIAFYGVPGMKALKNIIMRRTRMNPWVRFEDPKVL